MNILQRCNNCRTPFNIREPEIVAALAVMKSNGFKYYNAACPSCGRPNKISEAQLRRAAPRVATPATAKPVSKAKAPAASKSTPVAKAKPAKANKQPAAPKKESVETPKKSTKTTKAGTKSTPKSTTRKPKSSAAK